MNEATQLAEWFAKTFGKNFYVEIQDNGLDIQKTLPGGGGRHRQSPRPAAGGHLRCPLPAP